MSNKLYTDGLYDHFRFELRFKLRIVENHTNDTYTFNIHLHTHLCIYQRLRFGGILGRFLPAHVGLKKINSQ